MSDQVFRMAQPVYPREMTEPMEQELITAGIRPLKTPDQVEEVLGPRKGSVMIVVNSVCGCAAGQCRPGATLALEGKNKPNQAVTVFAGVDREATEKARGYFTGYPPSSPSIALLKDGQVVKMLQRHDIENQSAEQVASNLTQVFEQHCKE